MTPSESQTPVNILDRHPFAWPIAALIVYSVITFSVSTLPNLSAGVITYLYYSEIVVVTLFTLEYVYRIYSAPQRLRFIFSFYGVIDLLAILPFYLGLFVDLQSLRMVRLLRLLRILKIARYNTALVRFAKAIYTAKEELIVFSMASFVILYLAAVGIYHFEHEAQPEVYKSIFDSLWWAVATLTTVGYGDIYPITIGGRLFTFGVLMIGLGMIAVPTGIVASSLSAIRQQLDEERKSKEDRVRRASRKDE